MKRSNINFNIELDNQNIPEKIYWSATESPTGKEEETKAIALALWDPYHKTTLKIDLWSKDMPVNEMKQFYIETLGTMADSLQNATNDEFMAKEIRGLCEKLIEHVKAEEKKAENK